MRQDTHGGDIYRNRVELDFSVNVSPLGMPEGVRKALVQAVSHAEEYPDIRAEKVKNALEEALQVPKRRLVCGNGASELFMAVVHARKPEKIVLPVPSFSGYGRAAEAVGASVCCYEMKEEHNFSPQEDLFSSLTPDVDLLFLANPNNPAGKLADPAFLGTLFRHCRDRGIWVVLDECFLEFCEEEEKHTWLRKLESFPNLAVVRSFTKIYAIPGVRLGYLACADETAVREIQKHLPEWNLSVFAAYAGEAACREQEYKKKVVETVKTEREYLSHAFAGLGIRVFSSPADYLLLYTEIPLYEKLLKDGILIRDCAGFRGLGEGYYRISVKKHEDNVRLINAVKKYKNR